MEKVKFVLIELDSEEDKFLLELLEMRVKIVATSEISKEELEKIGKPSIYHP